MGSRRRAGFLVYVENSVLVHVARALLFPRILDV